jgi:hypothetical protein
MRDKHAARHTDTQCNNTQKEADSHANSEIKTLDPGAKADEAFLWPPWSARGNILYRRVTLNFFTIQW